MDRNTDLRRGASRLGVGLNPCGFDVLELQFGSPRFVVGEDNRTLKGLLKKWQSNGMIEKLSWRVASSGDEMRCLSNDWPATLRKSVSTPLDTTDDEGVFQQALMGAPPRPLTGTHLKRPVPSVVEGWATPTIDFSHMAIIYYIHHMEAMISRRRC